MIRFLCFLAGACVVAVALPAMPRLWMGIAAGVGIAALAAWTNRPAEPLDAVAPVAVAEVIDALDATEF